MIDIAKLRAELVAGHPDTGVYDADHVIAAGQLNAANRTKLRSVNMAELREWAAVGARAFKIRQGMDDTGLSSQQRNLCVILDKLMGTDDGFLDPSNPAHVTLVNELVVADVLSDNDKTALVAKATDPISRATEVGLERVKPGKVQTARK